MRLHIDEDVPTILVNWLRSLGHDLTLAGEISAGQTDSHWLAFAEQENRVIMTADKDFGDLIFRDKCNSHGVILLRLLDLSLAERLARLQTVWSVVEANPTGCFIVVTPHRVRIRPLS